MSRQCGEFVTAGKCNESQGESKRKPRARDSKSQRKIESECQGKSQGKRQSDRQLLRCCMGSFQLVPLSKA